MTDAETGERICDAALSITTDSGAAVSCLADFGCLTKQGCGHERPGRYVIDVSKPGYRSQHLEVTVRMNECHVETQFLQFRLEQE